MALPAEIFRREFHFYHPIFAATRTDLADSEARPGDQILYRPGPGLRPDPPSGAVVQLHSLYQKKWTVLPVQKKLDRRSNLDHRAVCRPRSVRRGSFTSSVQKDIP